jgi:hypothetical protein
MAKGMDLPLNGRRPGDISLYADLTQNKKQYQGRAMFKRVKMMRLAALAKRALTTRRGTRREAAVRDFGVQILYLAHNDNQRM